MPVNKFENALEQIESKLGLEDQPRVVVFHEKEGRRHAHAVWSRIDIDEMKAVHLSHYKRKLMDVSKQLYLENDWHMPKGYIDRNLKSPFNYTRSEWQQAMRTGQSPKDKDIKSALQDSWAISDNRKSFERALYDRGYYLAKGDKRGYVAVDVYGEVYSLPRKIGIKKAALTQKLGKAELLPSVDETKNTISSDLTKQFKRFNDELNLKHKQEMEPLILERRSMVKRHREARESQRMVHEERWQDEELKRSDRLRKGYKGIWDRLTGTHQKTRAQNEKETQKCHVRDQNEKETLISNQLDERRKLQSRFQQLREEQSNERKEFFADMDQQYKNIERQEEIRNLYEQETLRSRQTISNKDSMSHEPEM